MESAEIISLAAIVCIIPQIARAFFPKPSRQNAEKGASRIAFFDEIKGIAIIAVILIHAIYFYMLFHPQPGFGMLLINNLARFAIGFFLISSGVLLSLKNFSHTELKNFYLRKVVRVFIPYLIAVLIIGYVGHLRPAQYIEGFFAGSLMVPYYFMSVLLQLYILYPLLSYFRKSRAALIVCFFFSVMCAIVPQFQYISIIPFCGPYLFFFFYGMYLRDTFLSNGSDRKKYISVWVFLAAVYAALVFVFPDYYYNFAFVYSVAAFNILFAYRHDLFRGALGKPLSSIGQKSLWIFLIHFPIEYFLFLSLRSAVSDRYALLAAVVLSALVVSYACAFVLAHWYASLERVVY